MLNQAQYVLKEGGVKYVWKEVLNVWKEVLNMCGRKEVF